MPIVRHVSLQHCMQIFGLTGMEVRLEPALHLLVAAIKRCMHIVESMRVPQRRDKALPVPLVGLFYVLPLRAPRLHILIGLNWQITRQPLLLPSCGGEETSRQQGSCSGKVGAPDSPSQDFPRSHSALICRVQVQLQSTQTYATPMRDLSISMRFRAENASEVVEHIYHLWRSGC